MCGSIPVVDVFTVVFGGMLAFFVVMVLLLGVFSTRSPRQFLAWKPTRSPEAEAQDELDDVAQMIEAQNEIRRRRGAPEISEEEIAARVREDRELLRRWRES
jgi:ribosome-binding protein aMBF1 (putative translation factor)